MVLKTDSRASQTGMLRAEDADLLPAVAAGLEPTKPSALPANRAHLGDC